MIIDRFEGEFAVCEQDDLSMIDIPISQLHKNCKEGDVIIKIGEIYEIDVIETNKLREQIQRLRDSVFED